MPSAHNLVVFQHLAADLAGIDLSDEDIRANRIVVADPRDDPRFQPGAPPSGVRLTGFANIYKIGNAGTRMECMFSGHRHQKGFSFIFSDGCLRCIGPNCFAELAQFSGLNLIVLKATINELNKRQMSLDGLEVSGSKLKAILSKCRDKDVLSQCNDRSNFKYSVNQFDIKCWSFMSLLGTEKGQLKIKNGRWAANDPSAGVVNIEGWSALDAYFNANTRLENIISGAENWLNSYIGINTRENPNQVRLKQEDFRAIEKLHKELLEKLDGFDRFLAGDGLRSIVQAWNMYGSSGNDLSVSTTSLLTDAKVGHRRIVLSIESAARRIKSKEKSKIASTAG